MLSSKELALLNLYETQLIARWKRQRTMNITEFRLFVLQTKVGIIMHNVRSSISSEEEMQAMLRGEDDRQD